MLASIDHRNADSSVNTQMAKKWETSETTHLILYCPLNRHEKRNVSWHKQSVFLKLPYNGLLTGTCSVMIRCVVIYNEPSILFARWTQRTVRVAFEANNNDHNNSSDDCNKTVFEKLKVCISNRLWSTFKRPTSYDYDYSLMIISKSWRYSP